MEFQPAMDGLAREMSAQHDRLVRLQSVQNDIALNLPPSISLPDGEETPYGSSIRLQLRNPEQESEIFRKHIKPPPNRTIFDLDSPAPHQSNSAGLLSSDWSSGSRCHNVSSGPSKRPGNLLVRTMRYLTGKRWQKPKTEESSLSSVSSSPESIKPTPLNVMVPFNRSRWLSTFSNTATSSLTSLPMIQCVTSSTSVSSDTQQVSLSGMEELSGSD